MLPPPDHVEHILIWHNGALGDLLLAGPALTAIRRYYHRSRLTGVGHPECWRLLQKVLSLEAVWDAGASLWSRLFTQGELPAFLAERLSGFSLALVFTPRPSHDFLSRLRQAGVRRVLWIPSFSENGREPVRTLQARHLAELGLAYEPEPLHLPVAAGENEPLPAGLPGNQPLLTVAPGSGHAKKNWPLSHYFEVTRTLAWEFDLQVVWLAGPAELSWLPYLQGLARSQGQTLVAGLPLSQVARVLALTRLYLGGDSGITHLAVATGARDVLALFGPTDPKVWAPFGGNLTLLTAPGDCVPCTAGRDITCEAPNCLRNLSPEKVLQVAVALLSGR